MAGLRDAWRELVVHAAEPNSFSEPWFAAASLTLAEGRDVRLLAVRRGERGELIGLLPLAVAPRYGRIPVRNVQNWKHRHQFLGTPLVRADCERHFWRAVLSHLDAAAWAPNFLHIEGLVAEGPVHAGLRSAAESLARECPIVHRSIRAELASDLPPAAYFEQTVRKKKRKELKRLQNRLAELGVVSARSLSGAQEVEPWCDAFLALERSGWKGKAGSALGCDWVTERFFRDAVAGADEAGKLDFLRLDLDGRPLAMLVNFLAPPGSFSFKIAFDEAYARFSPGVLIQLENLRVLERSDIAWMDSCAAEDHPMIDSLWGERRTLVRVSVPLRGFRRGLAYRLCRALESASACLHSARNPA